MTSLTHSHPGALRPTLQGKRASTGHSSLTQAFAAAPRVPFDDQTPIVIFSDCHRGNGGRLDAFAPNRRLFLHVLRHYYDRDFTYIEAGDGDELWKHWRFADIERAHADLFDLLHRFHRQQRLHLLFGNHEELAGGDYQRNKGGLPAGEALVLERYRTGQRLFVVHGHQADLRNNQQTRWSRRFVRYLWTPVQRAGLASVSGPAHPVSFAANETISRRIEAWAAAQRQPVICGHTHRPVMARPGAAPYFNSGACLAPGQITGIEIVGGYIQLVRWTAKPAADAVDCRRHAVTPPIPLSVYH